MNPLFLTLLLGGGGLYLVSKASSKGNGASQVANPNPLSSLTTELSNALYGAEGIIQSQVGAIFNQGQTSGNASGGLDWSSSGQNTVSSGADMGVNSDGIPNGLALPSGDGNGADSSSSFDANLGMGASTDNGFSVPSFF